jgi:hypothetical protein
LHAQPHEFLVQDGYQIVLVTLLAIDGVVDRQDACRGALRHQSWQDPGEDEIGLPTLHPASQFTVVTGFRLADQPPCLRVQPDKGSDKGQVIHPFPDPAVKDMGEKMLLEGLPVRYAKFAHQPIVQFAIFDILAEPQKCAT